MRPSDWSPSRMSDDELDAVLVDFFRDELPVSLPPLECQVEQKPLVSSALKRLGLRTFDVLAVAAVILLAGLAIFDFRGPDRTKNLLPASKALDAAQGIVSLPVRNGTADTTAAPADLRWYVSSGHESLGSDVLVTESGLLEQRSAVTWETTTIIDPRTGDRVSWTVPTITVELRPIEKK